MDALQFISALVDAPPSPWAWMNAAMEAKVAQAVEHGEVLTGVPADRVEKIVAQLKAEGATSVKTKRGPDGNFTVEAIFAGCPTWA